MDLSQISFETLLATIFKYHQTTFFAAIEERILCTAALYWWPTKTRVQILVIKIELWCLWQNNESKRYYYIDGATRVSENAMLRGLKGTLSLARTRSTLLVWMPISVVQLWRRGKCWKVLSHYLGQQYQLCQEGMISRKIACNISCNEFQSYESLTKNSVVFIAF